MTVIHCIFAGFMLKFIIIMGFFTITKEVMRRIGGILR